MSNADVETHSFQTEVQQLLHLMIHSLYGHKEIFLRELISNASDASDRLRFAAITDKTLLSDTTELDIRISVDKAARTLTISDLGIGMSRDEVVENIGTIARSGTKQFMKALTGDDSKDVNLIGQFGVGFYSVFMVADQITLITRRAGSAADSGVRWQSTGDGSYQLEGISKDAAGTEVILHLRPDEDEFLDPHRLRHIVAKYSEHISIPIRMQKPLEEDTKKNDEMEWETVNKGSALWARPKNEISQEEYQSFYQTMAYDSEAPLAVLHHRVEGSLDYTTLFFIPATAPFDLWDRDSRHGVKLYVRRIFIMDDAKHLMPNYLRFVRGVVDSADLPLNVSREFLQHNQDIDRIRAGSVKKLLAEIKRMANDDADTYTKFWKNFGRAFKEGIVEDPDNRQTIAALLRFASTQNDDEAQNVSLDDYLKRMPLKQKAIYYISADSYTAAKDSPHLEIFKKRDIEVLLLGDPIDEWLVNHLTEYQDKPLKSVARGNLDEDDTESDTQAKQAREEVEQAFEPMLARFKEILGEKIKDVRMSSRLTDSPACLVADEHDMGANLERILKSVGQDVSGSKPIMELNPDHALIQRLKTTDTQLEDWAQVLFDQAALSEGAPLPEPAAYVRRVNTLLAGLK